MECTVGSQADVSYFGNFQQQYFSIFSLISLLQAHSSNILHSINIYNKHKIELQNSNRNRKKIEYIPKLINT